MQAGGHARAILPGRFDVAPVGEGRRMEAVEVDESGNVVLGDGHRLGFVSPDLRVILEIESFVHRPLPAQ
ncbi:hypothetical protein D3C81_2052910 [compost metagenome]